MCMIFLDHSKFYELAICFTDKGGQNVNAIIIKTFVALISGTKIRKANFLKEHKGKFQKDQ